MGAEEPGRVCRLGPAPAAHVHPRPSAWTKTRRGAEPGASPMPIVRLPAGAPPLTNPPACACAPVDPRISAIGAIGPVVRARTEPVGPGGKGLSRSGNPPWGGGPPSGMRFARRAESGCCNIVPSQVPQCPPKGSRSRCSGAPCFHLDEERPDFLGMGVTLLGGSLGAAPPSEAAGAVTPKWVRILDSMSLANSPCSSR